MKLNTHQKLKIMNLAALVASAALFAGCKKNVPYEIKDGDRSETEQRNHSPESEDKSLCYVSEGGEGDPREKAHINEVSILKPQQVVAQMASLSVGKQYEVRFFCYDQNGKEIFRIEKPMVFTPTSSTWWAWASFTPDHTVHKAGRWNWVADVRGF